MYCHKCGRELPERALFCPACGARSVTAEHESPSAASAVSAATSSPTTPSPSGQPPVPAGAPGPKASSKKKVILGLISALVVVVAVAAVLMALNWNSVDYVASVKAFQPFYYSQGLPYTYGEVLNAYLPDAEWIAVKEKKDSGLLATVEVSGTAKGLEEEVKLSVQMAPNPEDPNGALYTPESASLGEERFSSTEETVEFLYWLFVAYDQQVEDLSLVLPNTTVELTQTFEDEASGITFSYPENWMQVEPDGEFDIVSLIDSANNASSIASLEIRMALDTNPFGIFTDDESSIEQAVNEYHTFVSVNNLTLGGMPAVELVYRTDGLIGTDMVVSYWYERGGETYQVICSFSELTSLKYAPIFEEILDSFQIAPAPDSSAIAMDAYLNIISQASSYDFSGGYGDPNPPDATYSYALVPVCPGSDIPGLLLSCTNSTLGMTDIRVFQYDEVSGTVWEPASVLTTGVATAGGYRGSLALMGDGNGLYYYYLYAMTGDSFLERVTIGDGIIHHEEVWSGMVGDGGPTYLQGGEISWYDVYDTAGLQG